MDEPSSPPLTQLPQAWQKIADGGMGEVWLAGQKEPVRRRVALKPIEAGRNNRKVIVRFASERQALALIDHPGWGKPEKAAD